MPSNDARDVRLTLDEEGMVGDIHDERMAQFDRQRKHSEGRAKAGSKSKAGWGSAIPALDGEHFQWRLGEYWNTGLPVSRYRDSVYVATNERQITHNSVKTRLPDVVLLDCGLWGAYKRAREYGLEPESEGPQRDFGLIEYGRVWRAQYVSALNHTAEELQRITDDTCSELRDSKSVLGLLLARLVRASGVGAIKLWEKTRATRPADHGGQAHALDDTWRSLYVCFPDLHLSDRWADLPPNGSPPRHPDAKARQALQKRLRGCQSLPGIKYGNSCGPKDAQAVQDHLDKLEKEGLLTAWDNGDRGGERFNNDPQFVIKRRLKRNFTFTPAQFLAEKDIVDRALRIHSTWFCGPGRNYVQDKRHEKEPVFGHKDDLLYQLLATDAPGDAGPAFDLVNLLIAIRKLRRLAGKDWRDIRPRLAGIVTDRDVEDLEKYWDDLTQRNVRVRQVGDMFEMWMNHEFLYHGFWVRQRATGVPIAFARSKIRKTAKKTWLGYAGEDFQARKDEYHFHPEMATIDAVTLQTTGGAFEIPRSKRRPTKWYSYNHMHTKDQKYRHVVGDMITEEYLSPKRYRELERAFHMERGEIPRRQYLLAKRMESINAFSLPLPDGEGNRHGKTVLEALHAKIEGVSNQVQGRPGRPVDFNFLASFYLANLGKLEESGGGREGPYRWQFDNQPQETDHTAARAGTYVRTNARGQREILWNKLILDLFSAVGGRSVYGNHDGYRGDPLLAAELPAEYKADGWISEAGLWFEHGHRWDEYNRDGCAFGSGATNLVYYYMHILGGYTKKGEATRKKAGKWTKEAQMKQVAAGIWFLLVRYQRELAWFQRELGFSGDEQNVFPFGIYVSGHSHSADLVRLRFGIKKKARERIVKQSDSIREGRDKADSDQLDKPYMYKSDALAKEEERRFKARQKKGSMDPALIWLKRHDIES